ncbi:HNH endonuclease signature motif containing protein [Arthrobacter sp. NPDC058288]|uniref:HNH endonuclease signature motif containing protein n=1 Tax=Arthrobacter sp. NPDC058288 TaxID=3346424 RepID=UPI0036EEA6CE
MKTLTTEQLFWSHVDKSSECWEWTARRTKKGYGMWAIGPASNNKAVMPHRYSYELHVGPIPDGMQVDHRCHNRTCVNPAHLRLATNKQNNENPAGLRSDNTSGYRGVRFNKRTRKWAARAQHNGREHYGGEFPTPEQAGEAARELRLRLFTHNDADRTSASPTTKAPSTGPFSYPDSRRNK